MIRSFKSIFGKRANREIGSCKGTGQSHNKAEDINKANPVNPEVVEMHVNADVHDLISDFDKEDTNEAGIAKQDIPMPPAPNPDRIYIGYSLDNIEGKKHVFIEIEDRYRHCLIVGTTGSGKRHLQST